MIILEKIILIQKCFKSKNIVPLFLQFQLKFQLIIP